MTITNIYAGLRDISWKVEDTGPIDWKTCFANDFHKDITYQSMACNTSGGATDEAMLNFMKRLEGANVEELKKKHGKGDFEKNVTMMPFSSKRK